jgi:hypothetical protein
VPAGDRSLAYADFPFAASIIALLSVLVGSNASSNMTQGLVTLTYIGILSTILAVIEPVERLFGHMVHFLLRNVNVTGPRVAGDDVTIAIRPITSWVWNSTILSYSKNRITALVYSSTIFSILSVSILSSHEKIIELLRVPTSIATVIGFVLLVVLTAFLVILSFEARSLRWKVAIADVYMLMVEGRLQQPNQFVYFERAIRDNDWVTARYYMVAMGETNRVRLSIPI